MNAFIPRLVLLLVIPMCGAWLRAAAPDLGECYGPYRIQPYLKVAAALQAMPEGERAACLQTWAQSKKAGEWYGPLDDQVIRLCRILFERKPGGEFRASHQGLAMFASIDTKLGFKQTTGDIGRLWPDAPFVFMDDVPFDVASRGHMLAGVRESAEGYLAYCLESAQWTSRDYAKVLKMDLEAVLNRLINDYPWPGRLSAHDRDYLAAQIKPYEPPRLWSAVRGSNSANTTHTSFSRDADGGRAQRINRVEKLAVTVEGGRRPYRYRILYADKVLQDEAGGLEPRDPFSWQEFSVPWPLSGGDGWLRFEVTDADGTRLVQSIKVIDERSVDIYRPLVSDAPNKAQGD